MLMNYSINYLQLINQQSKRQDNKHDNHLQSSRDRRTINEQESIKNKNLTNAKKVIESYNRLEL